MFALVFVASRALGTDRVRVPDTEGFAQTMHQPLGLGTPRLGIKRGWRQLCIFRKPLEWETARVRPGGISSCLPPPSSSAFPFSGA